MRPSLLKFTLACAALGGIGFGFLDTGHITSDHTRTGSNATSSGDVSSGLMGLETPNDSAPEPGGLTLTRGQARTTASPDDPIPGTSVRSSNSDKTIKITGLSLATRGTAGIWLDLSAAYSAATTFAVTAIY